jgi:hypothetical protein
MKNVFVHTNSRGAAGSLRRRQSLSWSINPPLLWDLDVHCRAHNSPQLDLILSQTNPFHTPTPQCFKIKVYQMVSSLKTFRLYFYRPMYSSFPHACYMFHLSHES